MAEPDVTAKVQVVKGALAYDRLNKNSYLNISLKNISPDVLLTPVKLVVDTVTPATVTVANADGVTADGKPYILYTAIVNGSANEFTSNQSTAAKKLVFNNPAVVKFSYTTRVPVSGRLRQQRCQPCRKPWPITLVATFR